MVVPAFDANQASAQEASLRPWTRITGKTKMATVAAAMAMAAVASAAAVVMMVAGVVGVATVAVS
jgi:hypothetical protein